jgi:heptosyltransferase-3
VPRQEIAASLLPSLLPGARIFVIRLRSIGDIVLLTPALRLLKEWRPELRVSVVIEPRFRELLEGNPDVDEILDPGTGSGWAKVAARGRALREIRARSFALCLNLHGGPTSALLTRLSGARWKAGFAHFRQRRLYQILIPDARIILGQPTIHTAEHQASALFHLGLPRQQIPPARLLVAAEHEAWWKETRSSLSLGRGVDYALLHPAALYATKQWAPENFARLGAWLEGEAGLSVVYACGPGETAVLDAVESAAGGAIRRLAAAGLGQFAAALAGARLFVGNDSGPAHMATALGRPGVVVFGSSSSAIWGPWSPVRAWRVVQNPYDCNPCPGDRCYRFARPECILSVSFEQVRAAVQAVLAESGQATQ